MNPVGVTKICFHTYFHDGSVAQLNRASDYGSEGYRFESCRSHKEVANSNLFFYLLPKRTPRPLPVNSTKVSHTAVIMGKYSESDYPTSIKLEIKKGARVMTLINRRKSSGELEFVNGVIGEIVKFHNVSGNCWRNCEASDCRGTCHCISLN